MLTKLQNWVLAIGQYKDGITAAIAIFILVIGFYQYLEIRSDKRIQIALDLLERRETKIFVDARTKLLQTWFEADGELKEAFKRTDTYTDELYEEIDQKIHSDLAYRSALLHISAFYSNASACVLDGLCDQPTVCSSLHGEIQDYLNVNRNYFVYLRQIRQEDSAALYLHHPEFVEDCDDTIMLSLFSRTDKSWSCQMARRLQRTLGAKASFLCQPTTSEYTTDIIQRAK